VAAVYEDTPAALHPIALLSVRAHLEMAAAEGKVEESAGSWVLAQTRG
jgi:endoribonuclease LACTB2